ncbi:hypothetical protein [Chromobacterium violaceum]|uniref:hypothetical protein n=1 Tax=Chromobacterium violaceum TaxID=536 RepID=UPI0018E0BF6E|nr:hypothetical protein [Chromobacterium violaceum]
MPVYPPRLSSWFDQKTLEAGPGSAPGVMNISNRWAAVGSVVPLVMPGVCPTAPEAAIWDKLVNPRKSIQYEVFRIRVSDDLKNEYRRVGL